MSETRRHDPLRRAPPTIDLKAREVGAAADMSGETKPLDAEAGKPAAEGATAVEPVATTGLGAEPFPAKAEEPSAKASDVKASDVKAPDVKAPDVKPSVAKTPDSKAPEMRGAGATTAGAGPTPPISAPASSAAADKAAATPPMPASKDKAPGSPPSAAATSPMAPPKPEPPKPASSPTSVPPVRAGAAIGAGAGAAASAAGAESLARSDTIARGSASSASTVSSAKTPTPNLPDSAFRATDPVPPSRTAKSRLGGLLAAGLLGGVAGAAVAAALMPALPARTDTATTDRLAALERRVAAVPTGTPTATLEPRIAALEAGLKSAADEARAARTSAEAAGQRANEAASRPVPATAPPADPTLRPALDALAARVEDGAKRADANATSVRDLGTKLGEGLAAGTAAAAALESSMRGVQTDLGTVKTATGALETRSTEAARRLEALSGQVAGVSGDLAKLSPAASQAGLRLVLSGRLDEALRAGTPLGTVVAALERLGVEPGLLAPLRPFAETAAPTPAALASAFTPLVAALTSEPAASTESAAEKVRRLFGKVVTVRAVGDGSGTDLPGLVARIESALARGAVGEAASAWDGFPDSAKRATADWGARLKARAAADDGARRIGSQSLAALDAVGRPAPSR